MYPLNRNVIIFGLLIIVAGLITFIAYYQLNDNLIPKVSMGILKRYKVENDARDSLISVLRAEIAEIRNERPDILKRISISDARSTENKKLLDYFNWKIYEMQREINLNRPNYSDSSAAVIDDRLPK